MDKSNFFSLDQMGNSYTGKEIINELLISRIE